MGQWCSKRRERSFTFTRSMSSDTLLDDERLAAVIDHLLQTPDSQQACHALDLGCTVPKPMTLGPRLRALCSDPVVRPSGDQDPLPDGPALPTSLLDPCTLRCAVALKGVPEPPSPTLSTATPTSEAGPLDEGAMDVPSVPRPALTPAERAVFERAEKEGLSLALRVAELASEDDPRWSCQGVKQGVKCERLDGRVVGGLSVWRGWVEFDGPVDPRDVVHTVWTTPGQHYSDVIEETYVVSEWAEGWPNHCIFHQSYHGMMGFPGRDFLQLGTRHQLSSTHVSQACVSVDLPHHQGKPGRVRGRVLLAGYDCRVLPSGRVRLTFVSQSDLRVKAPEFLLRTAYISSLPHIGKVADIYKRKRARKAEA